MNLVLDRSNPAYRPGERIEGELRLDPSTPIRTLKITLGFAVEGRVQESDIADCLEPDPTFAQASRVCRFTFIAPHEPFSYEGQELRIRWCIEAEINGKKRVPACPLVISPTLLPFQPPFL
jgi:hypothetical protein